MSCFVRPRAPVGAARGPGAVGLDPACAPSRFPPSARRPARCGAADHGGAGLWADPTVRFLDPCTRSGVFLREITSRLTAGLADQIPEPGAHVDHILTRQVFGIGITELAALLARRSVCCSRHALGAHPVAHSFERDEGNLWFERTEHSWAGDKCKYCGANRRGPRSSTHARPGHFHDDGRSLRGRPGVRARRRS
jgi:hypothetical protein